MAEASRSEDRSPGGVRKRRSAPSRFELCQIQWSLVQKKAFSGKSYRFWADAIGPKGLYKAGESPVFVGNTTGKKTSPNSYPQYYVTRTAQAVAAFDALAADLWHDGWQPSGVGRFWHDVRFRRVVSEPRARTEAPRRPDLGATVGPSEARSGSGARPDWYPDPTRRFEYRYWDGARWTEHVSRAGARSTDQLTEAHAPPATASPAQ